MINKVKIAAGKSWAEVELPDGLTFMDIVSGGPVLKGDLVYNSGTRGFDPVTMDGNVLAQQCYLVLRPPAGETLEEYKRRTIRDDAEYDAEYAATLTKEVQS